MSNKYPPFDTQALPAGGGMKKVLYTLATARRSGWRRTAKALNSKNACKTCGLGMGGQLGGMTNELGEFPSVCNKSVQAQSTDMLAPIPSAIFDHSLAELGELTEQELSHLGRLSQPLYKAAKDKRYQPISWHDALAKAAHTFAATPAEQTFFYASGRSSNEAGFILQLFARLYGTNNVNNCSYYCHQATTEALHTSIGTGTATVELADLANTDFVMLLGANPASNHPRFIYQLEQVRARGGEVVVINPAKEPGLVRFAMPKKPKTLITGGSAIASEYLQPHIGADIALLQGIAKAVIELNATADHFIAQHTENADAYVDQVSHLAWQDIVERCGVSETDIRRVAQKYAQATNAVFAWGMGLTHHLHGVANVEEVAHLALLRGMVGKIGAGLLPLRGHSNVQGIGTIGVKPILSEDVIAALESTLKVDLPKTAGWDTMACLEHAARGEVQAALLMGGNLYSASPDSHWAAKALGCIPFKVFLTTTLNRSHIIGCEDSEALVLPVRARDEEHQATTQESMFNYVRMSDGGIERIATARGECDILVDIALQVIAESLFDFGHFKAHSSIRQTIAKTIPGMQDLASIDVAKREFHIRGRLLHTPEFRTPSGRAQFSVNAIPRPIAEPFRLATIRSEGQFNTLIYEQSDSYRGAQHRWCVFMNPADLAALELGAGDTVCLKSTQGEMRGVTAYPFDLPPGNALAYFPEANVLVGRETDPRSKTPAFKSVAISIVQNGTRPI